MRLIFVVAIAATTHRQLEKSILCAHSGALYFSAPM
jgi:hypothetical protein